LNLHIGGDGIEAFGTTDVHNVGAAGAVEINVDPASASIVALLIVPLPFAVSVAAKPVAFRLPPVIVRAPVICELVPAPATVRDPAEKLIGSLEVRLFTESASFTECVTVYVPGTLILAEPSVTNTRKVPNRRGFSWESAKDRMDFGRLSRRVIHGFNFLINFICQI
jgi:hypothetical protein